MYEDVGDFTLKEIINEAPLGERAIATAALCTIHGLTYLHSNNIVAGNIRAATLFVNSIGVSLLGAYTSVILFLSDPTPMHHQTFSLKCYL